MPLLSIIYFVVSVIFIVVGILVFCGNTDLIHDYHRKNVKDFNGYGRGMGKCIIGMGVSFLSGAIIAILIKNDTGVLISVAAATVGFIIAFLFTLKVQKKYNGGLF